MPHPFRRGFGWSVFVRSLIGWEEVAPRLFTSAPVGELTLLTATLDDWRRFAAGDWMRHLRRVTLMTSPVEPIRVLSATPAATAPKTSATAVTPKTAPKKLPAKRPVRKAKEAAAK